MISKQDKDKEQTYNSEAKKNYKEISMDRNDQNDAIEQLVVTNINRTPQANSAACTLFLSTHEMFSRTDHLLSHKESLKSLND